MKHRSGAIKPISLCAALIVLLGCPGDLTPPYYYGDWVNDDPDTRYIARIVIGPEDRDTVVVNAYGACDPEPCDWEAVNGWFSGGSPNGYDVVAHYDNVGQTVKRVDLSMLLDRYAGLLTVHEHYSFYDSERPDESLDETFHRAD